jgi:hypothetical protein
MGLGVHSGIQLYMHDRQQCGDLFPEKKTSFCFNHPHNSATGLRSQKV